jgi:hypothetical protein
MPNPNPRLSQLGGLILLAGLTACQPPAPPAAATAAASALSLAPWTLPATEGAAQPELVQAPDGSMLLSWVARDGAQLHLSFSRFDGTNWSDAREIARGEGIGSGVDTPHLRQAADGALWAQWLRKREGVGHARDIVFARSADGGARWSAPQVLNLDDTPTEHGFVAMWPQGADGMGLAWLDGRATAHTPMDHASPSHSHAHAPAALDAATMLRAADFAADLSRSNESAVDVATCDCCQTDVATTKQATLLVYRDRAPGEIRDIAVVRREGAGWTAPTIVHADGWVMSACPINGPAIASLGQDVAVAWYTGAGDAPSVQFSLSADGGKSFAAPLQLAKHAAVLGHVDLALDADAAWVAWLVENGEGQSLRLARIDRHGGRVRQVEVAKLQAHGREAGVPKLLLREGRAYIAWTDAAGAKPALHGAIAQLQ